MFQKRKEFMNVDESIEALRLKQKIALRQIMELRAQFVDAAKFGMLAAPIIDALIADESATTPHRKGYWSEEEKDILRAAYSAFGSDHAADEAAKTLHRTKSQIKSMAANLRLK